MSGASQIPDQTVDFAAHGFRIQPYVVLSPPLIFTEAHCEQVATALYDSINETAAELKVAGLINDRAA